MKKVSISTPGKLMIMGEHAVLYGKPCIVTTIGQRLQVDLEMNNDNYLSIEALDVGIDTYKKKVSELGNEDIPQGVIFIEKAVENFYQRFNLNRGIKITTRSQFSSYGLGCSSAVTVSTIKALSRVFEIPLSNKELFDLAYKTVLDIQGKGSGFDVAANIYGGTIYFVRGGEVIKAIKTNNLQLLIGYSGVKADTVSLINRVAEKARINPKLVENIYNKIENLVKEAKIEIENKNWKKLGKLFNANQKLLFELGVSNKKLEEMISVARKSGAYGVKLSGAGGGDCMIAIVDKENKDQVAGAITKAGGQIIDTTINAEGVREENIPISR